MQTNLQQWLQNGMTVQEGNWNVFRVSFQGFFRKGKVLLELGKQSEALLQFQHCLTLNSSFHAAQYEIEKVSALLWPSTLGLNVGSLIGLLRKRQRLGFFWFFWDFSKRRWNSCVVDDGIYEVVYTHIFPIGYHSFFFLESLFCLRIVRDRELLNYTEIKI